MGPLHGAYIVNTNKTSFKIYIYLFMYFYLIVWAECFVSIVTCFVQFHSFGAL